MNLPTFDECQVALSGGLTPLQQFVYDNEPGAPHDVSWRIQLQAALDDACAPRLKKADGAAPRATKKSIDMTAIDPVITEASPLPAGKTWHGTGRFVQAEGGGDPVELGKWSNPAGDIEATRLTKATGIPHIVDPRSGDVVRAGGGTVEIEDQQLIVPDQTQVSFNPDHLVGYDVRPALTDVKSFKR